MGPLKQLRCSTIFVCLLSFCCLNNAWSEVTQSNLDEQMSELGMAIDDVGKSIASLKKDLLFPPVTRLQMYLSLSPDVIYELYSVKVSIDGKEKSYHIYSEKDLMALRLGGIQRFWEGNVALGEHKVTAVFSGLDEDSKAVERKVSFEFEKKLAGHAIELSIVSDTGSKKPDFVVKDWSEK